MKKKFVLLTLGLLLCSCHSNNSSITFKEGDAYITAYDSIDCPPCIVNPEKFLLYKDNFWILDSSSPSEVIHVINHKGEKIASGLSEGNGPNEVLEVTSIREINGLVYIYDSPKGILSLTSFEDSIFSLDVVAASIRLMDDAAILKNKNLLLLPIGSKNSYCIQDGKSKTTIDSLSYFPTAPKGVNQDYHALACTGLFEIIGDNNYAARIIAYDGGIDFFHIGEKSITNIKRVANFEMEYSVNDQGMPIPNEKSKIGYTAITSSKNMFFATFSDDKVFENTTGMTNQIHVFSQTGEPLRRYILDRNVIDIQISPIGNFLYAIGCDNNDTYKIYSYHLN